MSIHYGFDQIFSVLLVWLDGPNLSQIWKMTISPFKHFMYIDDNIFFPKLTRLEWFCSNEYISNDYLYELMR